MKIVQFLPVIAFGDGVGNDATALRRAMTEMGYENEIYAEVVDSRLPKGTAKDLCNGMPELDDEDIIIYHISTGSKLNYDIEKYSCRKMMIYHNITPAKFFLGYNEEAAANAAYGLDGMRHLADKFDYCLADSDFNRSDLLEAGYKCRIDVRPILIPFDDYRTRPDKDTVRRYSDGWTNIVFVGRVVPNKKHESIIAAFNYYKKHINKKSRLIFVGSYGGFELYYERLKKYITALELEDVIFTGHVKFPVILAYYKSADIFLCMSEHEGFCIPLVEAMFFDVPVIAYDKCAIASTLGGAGFLIDSNDPVEVSLAIDTVMNDKELREKIIGSQRERLKDFSYDKVKATFEKQLKGFIAGDYK